MDKSKKMDIRVAAYDSSSAAGLNCVALREAIREQRSGLRQNDLSGSDLDTWIGRVPQIEAVTDLGIWQSRNNALAALGLEQGTLLSTVNLYKKRFGPARLGIVIGSSTSSIDRTEAAYTDLTTASGFQSHFLQPCVHNPHAPGLFASHYTGITGPAITVNTACSSSAKVFATGARWLAAGIVDAVLVGGVDTLCLTVLHGFDALQLVSREQCKPFDHNRDGINLGEAAGFAVLVRATDVIDGEDSQISLRGYGESSDAYHMSHPHPSGLGARFAIQKALELSNLTPAEIQYINCHGTSSKANDLIEGRLMGFLFPKTTLCSSTKAWMGHTLGAAGITEAIVAMETLKARLVPGTLNLAQLDEALDFSIQAENLEEVFACNVMSNSFGFGGNNASLIFSLSESL